VKSAFLNGEIEEEVYVSHPPGFIKQGSEGKVLRVGKARYGLRQASRAWNAKLDSGLIVLNFSKCPSEHAVYTRSKDGVRLLLGVYDLIIADTASTATSEFKQETHVSQAGQPRPLGINHI
jgi:hypothetical protein